MDIKEAVSFLDDLMIKNRFYLSSRTDCLYNNKDKIDSMQDIFDLKSSEDFTYLFAVSKLLSDNSENVNKYLLQENKDSDFINNIREPDRKDMLLVATALEENSKFFSLAVYWVEIAERLAMERLTMKTLYFVIVINKIVNEFKYAASGEHEGFGENVTKIPVGKLGELKILGEPFDFFIDKEYRTSKFELTIEYEVNGVPYPPAQIRKDSVIEESVLSSDPIEVDFTNGIRIKKISCKPL